MAEASGLDMQFEFDLVSEELIELLEAGLPQGICREESLCPEGWDSRQIVAHMAELCEFWRSDVQNGMRSPESVVVGRSNIDPERKRRIEDLANLPATDLIEHLTLEIGRAAGFIAALSQRDLDTTLVHLTDGRIAVTEMISKHLVARLCEYLAQLKELDQLPPFVGRAV